MKIIKTYRGVDILKDGDLFCYKHTNGLVYKRWSLSSIQQVIRYFVAPEPNSRSAKCVAKHAAKRELISGYHSENSAGRLRGRKNDCTIRALSIVANLEYELAEYIGEIAGRELNHGFNLNKLTTIALQEGFRFERVPLDTCQLFTFLKIYPVGRYIIHSRTHAIAVIDGKVFDMGINSPNIRILGAWKFIS